MKKVIIVILAIVSIVVMIVVPSYANTREPQIFEIGYGTYPDGTIIKVLPNDELHLTRLRESMGGNIIDDYTLYPSEVSSYLAEASNFEQNDYKIGENYYYLRRYDVINGTMEGAVLTIYYYRENMPQKSYTIKFYDTYEHANPTPVTTAQTDTSIIEPPDTSVPEPPDTSFLEPPDTDPPVTNDNGDNPVSPPKQTKFAVKEGEIFSIDISLGNVLIYETNKGYEYMTSYEEGNKIAYFFRVEDSDTLIHKVILQEKSTVGEIIWEYEVYLYDNILLTSEYQDYFVGDSETFDYESALIYAHYNSLSEEKDYTNGYIDGYYDGYAAGLIAGKGTIEESPIDISFYKLITTIMVAPVTIVKEIINFEIALPNGDVLNLWHIVTFIVSIVILVYVVKLFKG